MQLTRLRVPPRLVRLARPIGLAGACVAAITYTAAEVRPVFVSRQPVVQRLVSMTWQDSTALRAPWLRLDPEVATDHPRFEQDRRAFALDLLGTGKVTPERADALAAVAVREAYRRKVPPALVFGVLMTENPELRSTSRSNVGAVGLMQIHARVWVRPLGRFFGRNLRDDETNLRYGVYILRDLATSRVPDSAGMEQSWRTALLRYNGCVRGTNTKNCHTYPDKVRRHVERRAVALCQGQSFDQCVAQPFYLSLRDDAPGPDPSLRLTRVAHGD